MAELGILSTQLLATDQAAYANLPLALQQLISQRLVFAAQGEDSSDSSSALQRWTNRLSSLIGAQDKDAKIAGLRLAEETINQSTEALSKCGKEWFNNALNIIARRQASNDVVSQAIAFLLACFKRATDAPPFSHEVANHQAVRKLAESLLQILHSTKDQLASTSFLAIEQLLLMNAASLTPLTKQIEEAALESLCDPAGRCKDAAAFVVCRAHMLSGKAQAANAWRHTAEGLHSSVVGLLRQISEVQGICQINDIHAKAALILPDLPRDNGKSSQHERAAVLLDRVEVLAATLVRLLSLPTERSVDIPLGLLFDLGTQLFNVRQPINANDATLTANCKAVVWRLHLVGAQLSLQAALAAPIASLRYAPTVLDALVNAIKSYPISNKPRSTLLLTYAHLVSRWQLPVEYITERSPPIVIIMLREVACLQNPQEARQAKARATELAKTTHKNKKQKVSPDILVADHYLPSDAEVAAASNALKALELVLAARKCPTSQLPTVIGLLLAICHEPAMASVTGTSQSMTSASAFETAVLRAPHIPQSAAQCLLAATIACADIYPDLIAQATTIFGKLASSNNTAMRVIAANALHATARLVTAFMPAHRPNAIPYKGGTIHQVNDFAFSQHEDIRMDAHPMPRQSIDTPASLTPHAMEDGSASIITGAPIEEGPINSKNSEQDSELQRPKEDERYSAIIASLAAGAKKKHKMEQGEATLINDFSIRPPNNIISNLPDSGVANWTTIDSVPIRPTGDAIADSDDEPLPQINTDFSPDNSDVDGDGEFEYEDEQGTL